MESSGQTSTTTNPKPIQRLYQQLIRDGENEKGYLTLIMADPGFTNGARTRRLPRWVGCGEGCSLPTGEGSGYRQCPLPRNFFSISDLKMATSGAFRVLFFYSSAIWFKRKSFCGSENLLLHACIDEITRNSTVADKLRDAFIG